MARINVHDTIDQSKFNRYFTGVFSLCSIAIIADGYDLNIFGVVVPLLMKQEGFDPTQIGALASYGLFGLVIGSFLFGTLADKIGRKRTIVISMCIYCLFTGLIGFSHGFTQFAVLRFLAGLGLAGVVPNVVSTITEYTPLSHRIRFASMSTVGIPVGTVLAAFAGIMLLGTHSWRVMFLLAFLEVILVILTIAYLPEAMMFLVKNAKNEKIVKILKKAAPDCGATAQDEFVTKIANNAKAPITDLFKSGFARNTILFWVAMFVNLFNNFGIQTWLPKLMTMQGYALGSSLQLLLTFNIGSIFGVILGGQIASKIGYKKTLVFYFLAEAILISSLAINSGMVVLSVLLFLSGMSIFGLQGMMNSYIAECHPLNIRTTAVGWAFGVGRMGAVVAPILGGILVKMEVPMPVNFLAFSLPAVLGMFAILFSVDYTKK